MHTFEEIHLRMTQSLLTCTFCDVMVSKPAVLSHHLLWVRIADVTVAKKQVLVSSQTVYEHMRVFFLDLQHKGCMRSTIVMDISEATTVRCFKQATQTYVTCIQGKHMVCMQTSKEFVSRPLGLSHGVSKHPIFLLGQSVSVGASILQGVGKVSVICSLVVSTYMPLKLESTYALFEKMTTEPFISIDFHLYFKQMGTVNVPVAYTTDTAVTDILHNMHQKDKLQTQPLTASTPAPTPAAKIPLTVAPVACCALVGDPVFQGAAECCENIVYDQWPTEICAMTCRELAFFD